MIKLIQFMSKNYFGLLDIRNAKYQGLINDDQFAGVGMLIDQTNTLAITTWKASTMSGPSLILYPNAQLFFGSIKDNKLHGIGCFQLAHNEKVIINFQDKDSKSKSQNTKIAYIISGQSVVELEANISKNLFKVVQVHYTKSEQDQLKFLSQIFNTSLSKVDTDLPSFLNKNYIEADNLFQLTGKNQLFFGFKDTVSIGFKIQNNAPISVGFFKSFPRNLIFGRKIYYNFALPTKTYVEEGYFDPQVKVFTCQKQKASSLEFQRLAEDYFKKSTTFRNQFIALDHLSQIHKQLKVIADQVKLGAAKRFGQTLLENDYGSSQQNPKDLVVKEYTLEEMKEQIYKAAAKRNKTVYQVSKSPIRQRAKQPLENLYLNSIQSPKKGVPTLRKTKESQFNRSPIQILSKTKQNNPNIEERKGMGFSYIHSNKGELIKDVNQMVRNTKNQQKAELQSLISGIRSEQKRISQKREFKYGQNTDEIPDKSKRYQRYEPKITPFSQVNQITQKSVLKSREGRSARYLNSQKAKQDYKQILDKGLNDIVRKDKLIDMKNNFQPNHSDTNNRSHSNLEKYKQRHKKVTIDNLIKKDQTPQYKYIDDSQSQRQIISIYGGQSQRRPEVKLLEQRVRRNKQNQLLTESEVNPRSVQHYNIDLNNSTHLTGQFMPSQRLEARTKPSVLDRTARLSMLKALEEGNHDMKMNSLRPMLYEKRNDQGYSHQDVKKIKRTYHYVD